MKFLSIFGALVKKKRERRTESLVERINASMENLCRKSQNLNGSLDSEKRALSEIAREAKNFPDSDEIFAAKLEQEILGNITQASSSCDSVLAGADPAIVKKAVNVLARSVRRRTELRRDLG